jgi:hypothetical protein
MSKLIPLRHIPYSARRDEAEARRAHASRVFALAAAQFEVFLAPGCYGGSDALTVGWVLTRAAAEALSQRLAYMPNGTCHGHLRYRELGPWARLTAP